MVFSLIPAVLLVGVVAGALLILASISAFFERCMELINAGG